MGERSVRLGRDPRLKHLRPAERQAIDTLLAKED